MSEYSDLESKAVDVSAEFNTSEVAEEYSFGAFLNTKRREASLKIVYELPGDEEKNRFTMRRLKAFIESAPQGQIRFVTVRATVDQHKKYPNEFTSGINWEKK